jgi:CHAD domain-containing protein
MASVPVLARLTARPVDALAEHLPAALEGDPHSIHQARVASRRLRELLPIVGGVLKRGPRRRLNRRLRGLTRALGPVREVDVELTSVDQMIADLAAPPVTAGELKRVLARERTVRLASLTERFDAGRVQRLLRRLRRLESTLAEGAEPEAWSLELARRGGRRAEALGAAVADAGALFASERLHAVRIAAKQLR